MFTLLCPTVRSKTASISHCDGLPHRCHDTCIGGVQIRIQWPEINPTCFYSRVVKHRKLVARQLTEERRVIAVLEEQALKTCDEEKIKP